MEKLGFAHVDESVLAEQAKCYAVGIQWVLYYYYSGVPSWSWSVIVVVVVVVVVVQRFSGWLSKFARSNLLHARVLVGLLNGKSPMHRFERANFWQPT